MMSIQAQDPCNYFKNEVDEFTGSVKISMKAEPFIAYTDSALAKYYKKKKQQYFEVDLFLAQVDEIHAMYFQINIQTDKAYDYYGSLYKGSKIMLKMKDGSVLNLKLSNTDSGDTDYDSRETGYNVYCVLNDDQFESISNIDVDKVRIYWSKGYEDYPCMDTGLMTRQAKCLKK